MNAAALRSYLASQEKLGPGSLIPFPRLAERAAPETVPTGVEEIDALTGGLPRGALTEICGPASSGRTSLLLSLMAVATARGEVCALVDAGDAFDPESAAAAGVDLKRLLWVRCGRAAVSRQPAASSKNESLEKRDSLHRMDQALRTADLLLSAGGFGLVVLDLGDVPQRMARRPLTSWFRFRRAVEHTPAVLVALEQEPCAGSCSSLVLRMVGTRCLPHAADAAPSHARLLDGLEIVVEVARSRTHARPVRPAATRFCAQAKWRIA